MLHFTILYGHLAQTLRPAGGSEHDLALTRCQRACNPSRAALNQSVRRARRHDWARRLTTTGFYPTPSDTSRENTCAIDFRAGTYVLVDTSSNGTYVNGAQVPFGKYHDYVLKDGDYIRLGEYELLVSIDKSNDFPPDESAIVAYDGEATSSAVKKSTANDLGADLDLSQLLGAERQSRGGDGRSAARCLRSKRDAGKRSGACGGGESRYSLAHDDEAPQGGIGRGRGGDAAAFVGSGALRRRLRHRACRILPGRGSGPARHFLRSAQRCAAAGGSTAARIGARPHGPEPGPQRVPKPLSNAIPTAERRPRIALESIEGRR